MNGRTISPAVLRVWAVAHAEGRPFGLSGLGQFHAHVIAAIELYRPATADRLLHAVNVWRPKSWLARRSRLWRGLTDYSMFDLYAALGHLEIRGLVRSSLDYSADRPGPRVYFLNLTEADDAKTETRGEWPVSETQGQKGGAQTLHQAAAAGLTQKI